MKIGLILSQTPGYSETFFNSKIKGLQAHGVEVRLFCQSKNDDFSLCPVTERPKVSRNPLLQSWYFLKEFVLLLPHFPAVARFIKLERKEGTGGMLLLKKTYLNAHLLKVKPDWLHFGFATLALGSETVAKAIGAKMAVSFRGFDMAVYPVKNPGCYKTLWKYVDKVHTISDSLGIMAKIHGMPEHLPIQKITPAIDIDLFKTSKLNYIASGKAVILTIGRLHWIKNFVQTLEALALLKQEGVNFTYKIIGEGPEYERIAFAAYQLGLRENVEFLGKLPHREVKNTLETADIYLQYSLQEGFCNAVLEAQAMGKLCVVSNAEGLAENVLHEQTGWVVPKNDSRALAKAIRIALELPNEEKQRISDTAQKRVAEAFNLEKQQREFGVFYKVTAPVV